MYLRRVIIAIIGVAFLLVLFYIFINKESHEAIEAQEINARQLVKEYVENEQMADQQFLGKPLMIKGVVYEVNGTPVNELVLEGMGDANVHCSVAEPNIDNQKINKGDTLIVHGECSGFLMDVIIDKCRIKK